MHCETIRFRYSTRRAPRARTLASAKTYQTSGRNSDSGEFRLIFSCIKSDSEHQRSISALLASGKGVSYYNSAATFRAAEFKCASSRAHPSPRNRFPAA
jgi:hypothetical protein